MKENNYITELQQSELTKIRGGESLWYWIAYGIGRTVDAVIDSYQAAYGDGKAHYHSAG